MGQKPLQYVFIIFITSFIGYGDGRWKKRDRENLYHDIDDFKKMAEKIEHEIDAFYEDYPDENIKADDIEKIHQEYVNNILEHKRKIQNIRKANEDKEKLVSRNSTNQITAHSEFISSSQSQSVHVSFLVNDSVNPSANWPKFEDILLEMGKRYDWKNDRWIKVKRKAKQRQQKLEKEDNSINFHEKHKFSYRTVKLNRKSRRNVVIAVTAVR